MGSRFPNIMEVRNPAEDGPEITAQLPGFLERLEMTEAQGGMVVKCSIRECQAEVRRKDLWAWALLLASVKGPSTDGNFGSKGNFSFCVLFVWLGVFICCFLFIKLYSWELLWWECWQARLSHISYGSRRTRKSVCGRENMPKISLCLIIETDCHRSSWKDALMKQLLTDIYPEGSWGCLIFFFKCRM